MDTRSQIKGLVEDRPFVLFMKGTRHYPMCAASARAVEVLDRAGIDFLAVDVQQDPFLRAGLPRQANWSGIPQMYVHGDLIGGCDVLVDLLETGELTRMARAQAEAKA